MCFFFYVHYFQSIIKKQQGKFSTKILQIQKVIPHFCHTRWPGSCFYFKQRNENENVLVCGRRPVAHNRRVSMSLAGEGDSVPLQDRARLNGQGHCRWIWKTARDSHDNSLPTSNICCNLEDSQIQNGFHALFKL